MNKTDKTETLSENFIIELMTLGSNYFQCVNEEEEATIMNEAKELYNKHLTTIKLKFKNEI